MAFRFPLIAAMAVAPLPTVSSMFISGGFKIS